MYEFKRIVVGLELDGEGKAVTVGSQKAAQQAAWVAQANEGSILFVHSTYDDEYHGTVHDTQEVVHEGLSGDGRRALEAVVAETKNSGVEADLHLCEDRAWLEIIRSAMRESADLTIVGKRDESSEDGRQLGNVAIKLLRKCPSPVWVVKSEHDLVHRCVLAATDLHAVGDLAVFCAGYVASRHECDLHVVHAWQMPFGLQVRSSRLSDEEFDEEVEKLKRGFAEHIKESLKSYRGSVEPRIHTSKGSPAKIIREAVNHLDPDLLVMGAISRAGLAGVLLGSTAERLLDRVDCSILAVKPVDFISPVTLE